MSWLRGETSEAGEARRGKATRESSNFLCFCTQRRGSRHHNRILVKSLRISGCRSNVPYYNTHQDSESTAKLANSVNFVASEKKTKNTQICVNLPPTHFFGISYFQEPRRGAGYVLHVALFVFCFSLSFLPSPVSPLLLPFSRGDMLEVIITIAAGFISIYPHNNTEKGRRQTALV